MNWIYKKKNTQINLNKYSKQPIIDPLNKKIAIRLLTEIMLQDLQTKEIDVFKKLKCLPKCEILYCDSKGLTSLPELPNCEQLICNNNLLTSLPSLEKCFYLDCSNNQLTSLPQLPICKFLFCNNNNLTSLPALPECANLNCSNNQLTRIPELPKIKILKVFEKAINFELVFPVIAQINVFLKQKCGDNFEITLDDKSFGKVCLTLNDQCISQITFDIDYVKSDLGVALVINSFTIPEEENKKYNTFLRSVAILIAFNSSYERSNKKFKYIMSIPGNWISEWLLISKFGFWYKDKDFDLLSKFKNLSKQQYTSQLKQQFKKIIFKNYDELSTEQALILDLSKANYDYYLNLCEELLEKIKCKN